MRIILRHFMVFTPKPAKFAGAPIRSFLPVLLDARRAQPGQAMLVDGILPGEEFLDGKRVAAAGFFKR